MVAWNSSSDDALRRAIKKCNPTRPLGPNANEALRRKWEEVSRSDGVPGGCSAQSAFDRAVQLGWRSYPAQKAPHQGGGGGVLKALGGLPASSSSGGGGGTSYARSHPAAYHMPKSSSGGGGGGGGSSSSSAAAAAFAAATATSSSSAHGTKRREQPSSAAAAAAPAAEGRPVRYKPGTVQGMQHLCSGISGGALDEAAFVAIYTAALDHYRD
jgi:hypothetical protein